MALPKPIAAHRLALVRVLGRVYGALASLKLAVVLIAAAAVVLAWATFIESRYGSYAVHFGVYGTWWFAALIFLLGLNVLCAALIRFPWKRYQTGFVITHAGILVLLLGCSLSWMGGIDAQMPVFEDTAAYRAFVNTQHFELVVHRDGVQAGSLPYGAARQASSTASAEAVTIPFAPGPFNWADYRQLPSFPWRLSRRDQGVLYDRDGIRLEVLDYLSDSRSVDARPLKLRVQTRAGKPPAGPPKPAGDSTSSPEGTASPDAWQSIELGPRRTASPHRAHAGMNLGGREELARGQQVVFWVAGSQAETEAFLNSLPEGTLGSKGQVVLYVAGKKHAFALDSLEPGARVPLGQSGLQLELAALDTRLWGASLRVIAPGDKPRPLMLLADYPEFSRQDAEHGVYGTYWHEAAPADASRPAEPGMLRGIGRPRIDLVQGTDGQLYGRTWRSPRVEILGAVPADGSHRVAFAGSEERVAWSVEDFQPHDRPGERIEPLPFSAKKDNSRKVRRALVELTVDDASERFWLDGLEPVQFELPPRDGQRKVVCGAGRRAALTLAYDEIRVGFRVRLLSFNRKLDPGTSMASHYSSLVDFLEYDDKQTAPADSGADTSARTLRKDVLITLNEPVNFSDPRSGRSYRLFQEGFNGPWKPGDEQFDQMVPSGSAKDQLFVSFLTVNYDPGRGLKYTGSLLIVGGVAVMYYMRAYFFRRRRGVRS
jgi:hypothetical protein